MKSYVCSMTFGRRFFTTVYHPIISDQGSGSVSCSSPYPRIENPYINLRNHGYEDRESIGKDGYKKVSPHGQERY